MSTISVSEAKARLTAIVREVAASGESVIISVNGEPVAELRPYTPTPIPGRYKGQIWFAPDAFDPMSDEEADELGL